MLINNVLVYSYQEQPMNEKNKIWIISEYYYPIVTSTGYYITEIAEFFAKNNYDTHVICTDASYNEKTYFDAPKEETHNHVHIHRIKTGIINKDKLYHRTVRLLRSSIKMFLTISKKVKSGDKVLVVTNPAFIILLMPIIKLFKDVQYQILVHDIFPENLVAIKKLHPKSLLYKWSKHCFDIAYSKASRCITLGRDMQAILKEKTQNKTEIVVIPNWADLEDVHPLDKTDNSYINEYQLQNKFIFQFAGNLGWAQGLPNLLKAIELVSNTDIHFLFIGSGAFENILIEHIKHNPQNNITHISFIDRKYQNEFLNACDVSIITLNDAMYGLGVPSKSYNIMASGKPLLVCADARSEISLLTKEHNIGWVVETDNPQALADAFQTIYKQRSDFSKIINNSRIIAEKHFSKQQILHTYLETIQ